MSLQFVGCYYLPKQVCGSCNLVFAEIKIHSSQYPHTALRAVPVTVPEHYVLAHHVRACTQHSTVSLLDCPVSAASCGCVHSAALLFFCRYVAYS